ncbi:MAG TPA: FAD-linked oxidase C-terminal domain-containing protein [Nitrospiria bacterium]|nr:FAD-linked oxidase C-terminal domain-containing protein [Nitrospiria bacterium]
MNPSLLKDLKAVLGEDALLYRKSDLLTYCYDASQGKGTPDIIATPDRSEQIIDIVRIANRHNIPFIARGAGTGLSGGSVPVSGGIVILLTRMNRILELDQENMVLLVEPGVVNLDIQNYLSPYGFYYPPDPASQRVSTIGGNLGENASGPHCLKYGGTLNYVTGIEVVLPEGDVAIFGGRSRDLRLGGLLGLFVGSEGTLGIATKIILKIIKRPEATKTILCIFNDIEAAVSAVSSIIANGIVPAVLEAMDRRVIEAVESSIHAGYPKDAGAVLLIEVDGLVDSLERQIRKISEICRRAGAYQIRLAMSEEEKNKLWEGRRSAFASLAKARPNILIEDGTVPRSRLPQAMKKILEIGDRYHLDVGHVFHAGDGNFHPMILFDERDEEENERVRRAGEEMLSACISFGGTISGEHGIGIEKVSSMSRQFDQDTLAFFRMIKEIFDPQNLSNPGKLLPQIDALPPNPPHSPLNLRWDEKGVTDFNLPDGWREPQIILEPSDTKEIMEIVCACSREKLPLRIIGSGSAIPHFEPDDRRYALLSLARLNSIIEYDPDDMIVTVNTGIDLSLLQETLGSSGQFLSLDPPYNRTIGGMIASNAFGPRGVSYGTPRDILLGIRVVTPSGKMISGGGRLVKNVAGYDITRLFVGSYGRLGVITEATFRVYPIPESSTTILIRTETIDPVLALARDISRMDARPGRAALLNRRSSVVITGIDSCLLAIGFDGYKEDVERGVRDISSLVADQKIKDIELIADQENMVWGRLSIRPVPPVVSIKARTDPAKLSGFISDIDSLIPMAGIISYPAMGISEILIWDTDKQDANLSLELIFRAASKEGVAITTERISPDLAWPLIRNNQKKYDTEVMERLRVRIDPLGIMNYGMIMGW